MVKLLRLFTVLSAIFCIAAVFPGQSQLAFGAACRDYSGRDDGHLITIVNNSKEKVVIGVFGSRFGADDQRVSDDTGYSHPSGWVIDPKEGSSLSWCVPSKFNGRFFARTGCDDNGRCTTGNCCKDGDTCSGNICTKTADPASLAELFVDSNQGTYYDISFVDGYDFPLMLKPEIPTRQPLVADAVIDASSGSYDFRYDANLAISVTIRNYFNDNITVTNATVNDLNAKGVITSDPATGNVTIKYKTSSIVIMAVAPGKSVSSVDDFNGLGAGVIRFGATSPVSTTGCSIAGCKAPPACQWGWLADGVCLSPYKMFEINYPDFKYRTEYYPLAAMCAKNMFLNDGEAACCGCGKTKDCKLAACPTQITTTNPYTGESVILNSSGCSPINDSYNLPGEGNGTEQNQITCNPTSDKTKTSYGTDCNPWPAFYKSYTTNIIDACGPDSGGKSVKSVYTWQYDDDHGLLQCDNDNAMGFSLTILPRDAATPIKNMVTFVPGYASDKVTPVSGTITLKQSPVKKIKFIGPDKAIVPLAANDQLSVSLDCAKAGFTAVCDLTYQGPATGFTVDSATSAAVCSNTAIFQDWKKTSIALSYPADDWCSNASQYRLLIAPGDGVSGHVCVGSNTTPVLFDSKANPPTTTVYLKDNDTFRLVQKCGKDKNGKNRIVSCIADFTLAGGFVPRVVSGAASVCTDKRINWSQVFSNHNLGLGAWVTDVDCVLGDYPETCPANYTEQDAKTGLQHHLNLPTTHNDPLKLDSNSDGKINQIDVIRMLRGSVGF